MQQVNKLLESYKTALLTHNCEHPPRGDPVKNGDSLATIKKIIGNRCWQDLEKRDSVGGM